MSATPSSERPRQRTPLLLVVGAALSLAYYAWLAAEPRGSFEFGYAPFAPDPLPYVPMRGFTYEQLWGHVARFCLLAPGLALLSAGWLRAGWPVPRLPRKRALVLAGGACVTVAAACMLLVLCGRAIVDDELAYRMQAAFLGEGRLAQNLGFTPPDVFSITTRLGYTGKYLPGEAIVQLPGLLAGVPALMHLPLLALTLVAWHGAMKLRHGARTADFATIALALSPMLMLTSATGLSEPTSLCCATVAALGYEWTRARRSITGALLVALGVGFGAATRPQSLVPIGAVLVPCAAWALVSKRAWAGFGVLAIGLGASAAAIGAYDLALGGSPLRLPWFLQCGLEHYGFGRVWTTELFEHTPLTALANLGVVLVRLNAWWLGLPCSLAVLLAFCFLPRSYRRWDIWYGVGLAIIAFEFGYYSPGMSDTGTLYHYELLLPGSLIAARSFEFALERFAGFVPAALLVHLSLGAAPFLVEQGARLARLVDTIHADSDRALARIHGPAVLFHETRASESRPAGWIFDSFPERNRGRRAPIVTFPNVTASLRARVMAAYPGRECWYYHRDPDTERAELLRCDDAQALMDRPFGLDDRRPLWIEPTAYKLTGYDPFANLVRGHVRDAAGERLMLCCAVSDVEALGAKLRPEVAGRCVPDHR